jgi:hypothetical protein
MDVPVRDMDDLELALLRRGVDDLAAERERCAQCHRSPLIGERIYAYSQGVVLCELCKADRTEEPLHSRLVLGSEFGQTVRLTDRRDAA